ncbi:MAG: S41 family peptidase [Oscillospiraceae bacterium]|nr:S41 family peptidase [Oscillospiraceae bacterium]
MRRKRAILPVLTLMLLASALTCLIILLTAGRKLGILDGYYYEMREYAALMKNIQELYIGSYEREDLSAAALRAAVDALGDRWSYYMTAEEYAKYLDNTANRFAGIGVTGAVDEETGGMRVYSVYKGSAAETGGVVAGDVIIMIDGENISGLTFDEMRGLLSRELGDCVELGVIRPDGTRADLTVIYSLVFADPVSSEMLAGNIGYIKLDNFETSSADGFIMAVKQLSEQGAQAFIYDVRGNGGGRVAEMTKILDYLLPEGEIFVSVDRAGNESITMSGPESVEIPCVVLVDRYSFSAAEYFAATIAEYGYGTVAGEQTTGKNRSQVTVTLPGGGALHISSGEYLTKNRVSLYDRGGLTPDHELPLNDEDMYMLFVGLLEIEDDPQIALAISLLTDQ